MHLVKTPHDDGGWTFSFRLTGPEILSMNKAETSVLFSPSKSPVVATLKVLKSFVTRMIREMNEAEGGAEWKS